MVVIPGRAGAMFTWMGLWAWVKLWDLGFAVVMMLDDILYTMMPRAPNLSGNEIMDPGAAWQRVMSVDPNYAAATYYNIIATCLFAVPLATGVFVKRGGGELMNIVHSSWQAKANGLGASAGTFVRALQAQALANQFYSNLTDRSAIITQKVLNGAEVKGIDNAIYRLQDLKAVANEAKGIE